MYVTTDQVRARFQKDTVSTTTLPDEDLAALIVQASRYFDLVAGVAPGYFEAAADDAEASTKTFYGDGTNLLRLDPYKAGTLDETITVPENYTAQTFIERNGFLVRTGTDGIALPWSYPDGWYQSVPVTVSAVWGYDATPVDVQMAVIEMVLNLYRESDPATVKLTNLENQPLRETMPPRVMNTAKRYRMQKAVFV
jgi:hypothetical protein